MVRGVRSDVSLGCGVLVTVTNVRAAAGAPCAAPDRPRGEREAICARAAGDTLACAQCRRGVARSLRGDEQDGQGAPVGREGAAGQELGAREAQREAEIVRLRGNSSQAFGSSQPEIPSAAPSMPVTRPPSAGIPRSNIDSQIVEESKKFRKQKKRGIGKDDRTNATIGETTTG